MRLLLIASAAAMLIGCGLDVRGDDIDRAEKPATAKRSTKPGARELPTPAVDTGEAPTPSPPQPSEDPVVVPASVRSTLSPYQATGNLTFERPISWTIAAFDPEAPIRYSVDGSSPVNSPFFGKGTVTISDVNPGRIQWLVGDSPIVHTFEVGIDPNLARDKHYLVEKVRFDASSSPVITAVPGVRVHGRMTITFWSQTDCPTCLDQILVGIDKATACLYHGMGQHPGRVLPDHEFEVEAPRTPGVYKVRTGFSQQYKCEDALIKDNELDSIEVATIIVQ